MADSEFGGEGTAELFNMGKAVPCSTMYLLDCRMPMHCQSLKERPDCSLFTCAVAFLQSVLKEHVIKGHNEFGLILWGTQENSNSLGSTAGIVEWLPLSRPTCARIIQLGKLAAAGMFCAPAQELSRSLSGGADVLQVHQHYTATCATLPDCDVQASSAVARNFNVKDALWCARKGFDKSSVRDGSKKIVVITCDDCPFGVMTDDDESRMKRLVRDIADANISVTCMPITCAAAFDLKKFWSMVMTIDPDMDAYDEEAGAYSWSVQERRHIAQSFKQRSLATLPLRFSSHCSIMVQAFSRVMEAKKPGHKYIDASTDKTLQPVTTYMCEDTAQLLTAERMRSYLPVGDQKLRVEFPTAELAQLKGSFGHSIGIDVLECVPASALELHQLCVSSAKFLYPSSSGITGSKAAFSAIWAQLLQREEALVAQMVSRSNAAPRLVALLPHKGTDEDDSCGLLMFALAYNDDIRTPPPPTQPLPLPADALAASSDFVKAMAIKFSPATFPNPLLESHYTLLHDFALGVCRPEAFKVLDAIVPNPSILAKAESSAARLVQHLYGSAGSSSADLGAKRKRDDRHVAAELPDVAAVAKVVAEGNLAQHSLDRLKELCKNAGLKVNGTKAVLAERLAQHFT